MTSALSTISGQFGKAWILGSYFPVIIFSILGFIFVLPLLPIEWSGTKQIESLDTQWQVLLFTIVTLGFCGLLYYLNIPIIRVYEGYPWRGTWLGVLREQHHRDKRAALQAHFENLQALLAALDSTDPRYSKLEVAWNRIDAELRDGFPSESVEVAPTRLGN